MSLGCDDLNGLGAMGETVEQPSIKRTGLLTLTQTAKFPVTHSLTLNMCFTVPQGED